MISIVEVTRESMNPETLQALAELLVNVVDDGASIGFLPPFSFELARAYWEEVLQPGVLLWIVKRDDAIVGTIQLQLAMKSNGSHRAEIAKVMVHTGYRKQGIARSLMLTAESRAKEVGRSLLVLDTREGDPSNLLYLSLGYTEAGRIPQYARSATGTLDGTVLYYKLV
ncbi:GNAT family N-acetyltransferase [Paenibacillus sp. LHD-117]|nr:GNAT family N-acetyltransferase [Paenibacillus sp. LHD-117]MDQ6421744.1 GNAT family N-acetyltransferase [Paenibacillus sp. LHD-117]